MFFENAKVGLNEAWRYFVGAILIFLGWQTVASLPLAFLLIYIKIKGGNISSDIIGEAHAVGIDKNIAFATVLSTFVLACLVLFLAVKTLHKKPFLSVVSSRSAFSWKRAAFGFFMWLAFSLLTLAIGYILSPEDYAFSFDVNKFIPLLLLAIFLLPFQTSFEELLFRGYLTQGVGLALSSRFFALLLPSICFGLLHSFNPEVQQYGFFVMMPFYIIMGLFLGILAIMDDGIEIPLGVHFANNFSGVVILTMHGSVLSTDALFTVQNFNPVKETPYLLAAMLVFIIITALIFKWKDWGKLTRKLKH